MTELFWHSALLRVFTVLVNTLENPKRFDNAEPTNVKSQHRPSRNRCHHLLHYVRSVA
jgi:hypothetical protein